MINEDYSHIAEIAVRGLAKAYAPYSGFYVSAALLTGEGRVYHGVNIENASYPAVMCAERTAFFKAVSEGERSFKAIFIAGCKKEHLDTDLYRQGILPDFTPPCGICRQVMREFCDPESFEIVLIKSAHDLKTYKLKDLLPESFGPDQLL